VRTGADVDELGAELLRLGERVPASAYFARYRSNAEIAATSPPMNRPRAAAQLSNLQHNDSRA
jgi:hypothetical protein